MHRLQRETRWAAVCNLLTGQILSIARMYAQTIYQLYVLCCAPIEAQEQEHGLLIYAARAIKLSGGRSRCSSCNEPDTKRPSNMDDALPASVRDFCPIIKVSPVLFALTSEAGFAAEAVQGMFKKV